MLMAAMGAFLGFTAAWFAWAIATPGDFFASGSPWLSLTLGAAAVSGGTVDWRVRSKAGVIGFIAITLCCAAFWIAAPDGWWASPPPTANKGR